MCSARYEQLQQMLSGQNDYSIPENQQELRSFVQDLDGNAFKKSTGLEVRRIFICYQARVAGLAKQPSEFSCC